MKFSFLVGCAVGYVLGARAGRERYEAIVRLTRRVVGSQTVQSTAGVLKAQLETARQRVRNTPDGPLGAPTSVGYANGRH
jgi:hypothetical protein